MATTIKKKAGGRPTKRPDAVTLDILYSDHTAREIADIYAVPEATVRNWIGYYRRQAARKEA